MMGIAEVARGGDSRAMDWTRQVDVYCERVGLDFWAEPANAVTNAVFLLVAVIMWRRAAGDRALRLLSAILFAIGLGSFLFHTTATIWAALADTLPIAAFVLVYLFLVNRRALHMGVTAAGLATLAFLPLAGLLAAGLARVPFLAISGLYWSVPAALLIYGAMLRRSHPQLVRGFAIGAGLLTVSITLRSLDMMLCDAWPVGTHFAWHLLNALMLGWMIHVALRDLSPPPLAAPRAGR